MIARFSLDLLTLAVRERFRIGALFAQVYFRVDIPKRWLGDNSLNRWFICVFCEYEKRRSLRSASLEVADT